MQDLSDTELSLRVITEALTEDILNLLQSIKHIKSLDMELRTNIMFNVFGNVIGNYFVSCAENDDGFESAMELLNKILRKYYNEYKKPL